MNSVDNPFPDHHDRMRPAARVCFVSTAHDPRDKRVVEKEALSLHQAGYEVIHVAPAETSLEQQYKGIKIVSYPSTYTSFGNLSSIRQRLSRMGRIYRLALDQKADIYHANEFDSWLILLFLKFRTGTKIVFDVHEFYGDLLTRRTAPWPLPALAGFVVRLFYVLFWRYTDLIIFANKHIRRDFPDRIRNGVDVENFGHLRRVAETSARATGADPDADEFTLVHVGIIGEERGLFQILDIAERVAHPGFKVRLFGRIVGTDPEAFLEGVRSRGLDRRVQFIDWISYDNLVQELDRADAGFVFFGDDVARHCR